MCIKLVSYKKKKTLVFKFSFRRIELQRKRERVMLGDKEVMQEHHGAMIYDNLNLI